MGHARSLADQRSTTPKSAARKTEGIVRRALTAHLDELRGMLLDGVRTVKEAAPVFLQRAFDQTERDLRDAPLEKLLGLQNMASLARAVVLPDVQHVIDGVSGIDGPDGEEEEAKELDWFTQQWEGAAIELLRSLSEKARKPAELATAMVTSAKGKRARAGQRRSVASTSPART